MKTFKLTILALFAALITTGQVGRELYRPFFHYTPAYNWMNDPNGLVYYNSKYHLFYQYNPYGMQSGNNSWGHAISTDLVNWEEKPVAIPVQNGVKVYSGSVVVDWNNTSGFGINGKPPLVAIYTGKTTIEDQRIAYSNDEGLTWSNYTGNPVLSMNNNQFRDPKVIWHKESGKWIMVVSQGSYLGIRFYSSPDLKKWTSIPGFGAAGNKSGFWECPDLFQLPVDNDSTKMKWVLMHSVLPTAQYFIGNFDGNKFTWENNTQNWILLDDFEKDIYNNWTVTGSLSASPATGTAASSGFLGSRLINTSSPNGNGAQGKLTSSEFTISENYISFLIGGGYFPEKACIRLIVNGTTVRTSTGMNENIMKWRNWDVSSYKGQTARLEVVDSVNASLGYISIDNIVQSDIIVHDNNNGQIDYGKDFYGLQSFSDVPNGRRIWLAWLNNWNYATQAPTHPWRGMMTIPRDINLETHNGAIKLVQKPVEELKILRKDSIGFKNTSIESINNFFNINTVTTIHSTLKQFELKANIAVTNKSGFSLKFKKRGLQYSEYVFDFINKEIRFNRSMSGALTDDQYYKQLQVAPLIIENGFIDLHLFVDNSSAELFASNGQIVMSNLIFPDSTSNRIEITSLGDDFIFDEFYVWNFKKNPMFLTTPLNEYALFKIYPNPIANNNGLTIKLKDEVVGKVTFKLFDTNGKLVSTFQPTSNSLILPRNRMPQSNGLYFIVGSNGLTTQIEKLVVLVY